MCVTCPPTRAPGWVVPRLCRSAGDCLGLGSALPCTAATEAQEASTCWSGAPTAALPLVPTWRSYSDPAPEVRHDRWLAAAHTSSIRCSSSHHVRVWSMAGHLGRTQSPLVAVEDQHQSRLHATWQSSHCCCCGTHAVTCLHAVTHGTVAGRRSAGSHHIPSGHRRGVGSPACHCHSHCPRHTPSVSGIAADSAAHLPCFAVVG